MYVSDQIILVCTQLLGVYLSSSMHFEVKGSFFDKWWIQIMLPTVLRDYTNQNLQRENFLAKYIFCVYIYITIFTRMQDGSNLRQPTNKTCLQRENVFIQM